MRARSHESSLPRFCVAFFHTACTFLFHPRFCFSFSTSSCRFSFSLPSVRLLIRRYVERELNVQFTVMLIIQTVLRAPFSFMFRILSPSFFPYLFFFILLLLFFPSRANLESCCRLFVFLMRKPGMPRAGGELQRHRCGSVRALERPMIALLSPFHFKFYLLECLASFFV